MATEAYKELTREYAEMRNKGIENKSDLSNWEYEQANLSWPDGFQTFEEDFQPLSRRGKQLGVSTFPKND